MKDNNLYLRPGSIKIAYSRRYSTAMLLLRLLYFAGSAPSAYLAAEKEVGRRKYRRFLHSERAGAGLYLHHKIENCDFFVTTRKQAFLALYSLREKICFLFGDSDDIV
jgi:hypothetical protein